MQKNPKKKTTSSLENGEELQISNPILLSRTTPDICLDFLISLSKSNDNIPNLPPLSNPKFRFPTPTTPILFSGSVVPKKPPPVEKKLECSLEDLFHGSIKKIHITRDVVSTSGLMIREEETLTIKVKPGWKKGTKITFEGKGDARPGTLPADIIFTIDEKIHPLFKREGDNLELGVEISLLQALTGCTLPVPLLGGGQITLTLEDEIIYPGYHKIIQGQGMPISKHGARGDLILNFLVTFPTDLTDDERTQVATILQSSSYS